jgi:prepilin-type N-terminal cleavage/methylation domain-containing protein
MLTVRVHTGFTLAELLIALALLGVLSTFAIVKTINASNVSQQKAVFKETIATLQSVYYQGVQDGSMRASTNLYQFFKARLNAIKCVDNANVGGLWIGAIDGGDGSRAGCLLASGAVVIFDDMDSLASGIGLNTLSIDVNGPSGLNTYYTTSSDLNASDRILLRANPTASTSVYNGVTLRPGTIMPDGINLGYYNSIFN